MSTLSSFTGTSPTIVFLSFSSASVTSGDVLNYTASFDTGSRWNATDDRITAPAAEVWHIRPADERQAASAVPVSVYKNGSAIADVMGDASASQDRMTRHYVGTFVHLAATDYLDLRASGTGTLGTHSIVCERVAW